ncbi:MAG: hypothetical protein MK160_14710 [Rhodobacteraceae bacterium]|nr:hypothetical protein [Paracoccaceae bacterium]
MPFLLTLLAPLGFGSGQVDPDAVVAFNSDNPGLLTAWNTTIYIVNALALAVLVVALSRMQSQTPDWAAVSQALGLIWAALVLGAGMIANVALERAAVLAPTDAETAAEIWFTLHAVELGLGGGNEIAGGAWIGCVSLAGLLGHSLNMVTVGLGLVTSAGGLATLVPSLGDTAGVVFGLGAIAWFLAVGLSLFVKQAKS